MTSKNSARRHDKDDVNPKIDPAPNWNTEQELDDWVSGDDPMSGALKTLLEECSAPDAFASELIKAEASKQIDALKSRRSRRVAGNQP